MCKHGDYSLVDVRYEKGGKLFTQKIDACIAPTIKALQDSGVITESSCCGHGKWDGFILMGDGSTMELHADKGYYRSVHNERAEWWGRKKWDFVGRNPIPLEEGKVSFNMPLAFIPILGFLQMSKSRLTRREFLRFWK